MREESHLDEMRDAIRGDFERLAERRGEQGLMRVVESESDEKPLEEQELGHEPATDVEPERRSWLARILSS